MHYHISLRYLLMLAFKASVAFEDKWEISLEEFKRFRQKILLSLNDWALNPLTKKGLKDYMNITSSLNFVEPLSISELYNILTENMGILSFDGEKISMSDNITLEDIDNMCYDEDMNYILDAIDMHFWLTNEVLFCLNLSNFKNSIDNIISYEKLAELYYNNNQLTDEQKEIFKYIFNYSRENILNDFQLILEDDISATLFLDYVALNQITLPILFDDSIYESKEEKEDVNFFNNFCCRNDSFLCSIFSNSYLSYSKFYKMLMEKIPEELLDDEEDTDLELLNEEFDEFEEICDEEVDSQNYNRKCHNGYLFFVLTYIRNLEKYISEHGEDNNLLIVKNRLIYLHDTPNESVLTLKDREDLINKIQLDYDIDSIFSDYDFIASSFIYDIFSKGFTCDVIKKILFIKTSYTVFNVEEYREAALKFKNHPKFDEYFNMMFGKEFDGPVKKFKL